MTESADLEDFVSLEEAARRMEISEDEVLALARSAFLFSRWKRGRGAVAVRRHELRVLALTVVLAGVVGLGVVVLLA